MNVNWDLVDRLRGWEDWDRLDWNVSVEILVKGEVLITITLSVPRGWLVWPFYVFSFANKLRL
jgi:hypothetical protein